ncbi:Os07g0614250, partial [Oryza sativa Japonica Group]
QLGAALVAAEAGERRADLRHHDGALVVHLVAGLDAAHAAEAVGEAAAAAGGLVEDLERLQRLHVAETRDEVLPGGGPVAEPELEALERDPSRFVGALVTFHGTYLLCCIYLLQCLK